ncbi:hypothetical protein ABIC47_001067 [Leifsonia sp. 563]|uniref:AbiJ-NTD4 domain-containing protein n=1 Tax=Leifsonia sp. 563 TaxID=3156412 RepID=UPI00339B5F68
MASFSERYGYKPVRTLSQRESLDDETRIDLWNIVAITPNVFEDAPYADATEANLIGAVWVWHFRKPRDEMPSTRSFWNLLKTTILTAEWNEVFDLLEDFVHYLDRNKSFHFESLPDTIAEALNSRFEDNLVGYRFIGHKITPVDSATESEAVSEALADADQIKGARHSLERAVDLLADRAKPDYPNSIKESISAVEAVVKKVTGEGQLGAGLKKLEQAGLTIHPALKEAWSKMYGWTSDADGIRHAGIEAADADQAIAKYMLVTCSAFVSYLIEAGRKTALLT